MSGHTPGPWSFEPDEHGKSIIIGNDTYNTCVVPGYADNANNLANARLIAAAPDLLAALKGVVRVADRRTVEFDAARAAIAKADGAS